MKNLLYKEFKLVVHPICYFMLALSILIALIPGYPLALSFFYMSCCYPIIFLGANKGQQSNDLLYSALLPIRKKDIVKARTIILIAVQLVTTILVFIASFISAKFILPSLSPEELAEIAMEGLGPKEAFAIAGISLVGYGVYDIIYFALYYKNGKSIILSSILSLLFYGIFISFFTMILPLIPAGMELFQSLCSSVWPQLIFFVICLVVAAGLNYVAYRVGAKNLEKVDL